MGRFYCGTGSSTLGEKTSRRNCLRSPDSSSKTEPYFAMKRHYSQNPTIARPVGNSAPQKRPTTGLPRLLPIGRPVFTDAFLSPPYNGQAAPPKNSTGSRPQERQADNPSNWITSEWPTTRPECAARELLFYITTVTDKALTTLELRELHRPANLARLISPE